MAKELIASSLVPFTSVADTLLVIQAAHDLNIPVTWAISNLYPIQKRLSAGVHVITGLLWRSGVTITVIEDFVPVAHFIGRGSLPVKLSSKEINGNTYQIVTAAEFTAGTYDKNKIPVLKSAAPYMPAKAVDHRTTILFTRYTLDSENKSVKNEMKISYYLHEAWQAGYFADGKDNWLNHTGSMMFARCVSRGKRIGSDIIGNMMEVGEAADTFNIPYNVEKGTVVLQDKEGKEITTK